MAEIINDTDIDVVAHVQGGPDPAETYNLEPGETKTVKIDEVQTVSFYDQAENLLATEPAVTNQDAVTLTFEEGAGFSATSSQLEEGI